MSVSDQSQEVGPQNPHTGRDHSDTRDIVGLASDVDCTEVRWECEPKSGTAKDISGDIRSCDSNGRRKPRWGYRRIQGALANLGHLLAHTTIANILKRHGIEPAPERTRQTTWKEFLDRHWDQILASDLFTWRYGPAQV